MVIYKNKLEITGSGGVLHLQWLSNKPHGTQLKLLLSRKIKNIYINKGRHDQDSKNCSYLN